MSSSLRHAIESRPLSRSQLLIVAAVLATLVLDGLDIQILSVVAPVILKEWGIAKATFAPALAAAMMGMAVGSPLGGYLGDRFGRKAVLAPSVLFFGSMTMLAALCSDVTTLAILRFLSGVGFGAATPNGFALATEWLPQRFRPRAVGILTLGVPLGGAIGSGLALLVLPAAGWRGSFVLAGLLAAAAGILILVWLPESIAHLLSKGKEERAAALLARYTRPGPAPHDTVAEPSIDAPVNGDQAPPSPKGFLRTNLGAPLAYFSVAYVSYGLAGWLPTVLTGAGLSVPDALKAMLFHNLLALAGVLGAPYVVQRFGSKVLLLLCSGLTLALLGLLCAQLYWAAGWGDTARAVTYAVVALLGCTTGAATTGVFTVATLAYPPSRRSRWLGIAMMGGRIGGIATLYLGGPLLSMAGGDVRPFFLALGLAAIGAVGATLLIDRHVNARDDGRLPEGLRHAAPG